MIIKHEKYKTGPYVEHKITIVSMHKPQTLDINQELQWFGVSLGLFNLRDKDRSCFRVFIELLKAAKSRTPLSSDELAERTQLTRGTVMHHVNKLIDAGIVITLRNKYTLRADTLEKLIIELKKDMDDSFSKLKEVASRIDNKLGI
jgi:predicted transcriptional regulator